MGQSQKGQREVIIQAGLRYGEDSINQSEPKTGINSTMKMKVLQGLKELYREKNKPYIAMIFIQFVYAGMSLLSKAAVTEGMNPYIFVVYRLAFATMALTPFAFFMERKNSASLSFILICKMFLASLCGICASLNIYYFALNYVTATFATAFTNTIPAITFIIAVCLRIESIAIKQSHGIAKILGSAVGVSGALIFTFVKGPPMYPAIRKGISHYETKTYSKGDWIKGSFLMLLANITWSSWIVMQGFLIKQYPAKLRLTTLQIFFSCILSAIWAISNERSIAAWTLRWNVKLFSVFYCGIIVTAVTYWLQIMVVEMRGPVFTALFSPLALLITAVFSVFLFKETLHWGSACGVVLLVIGLYSVLWAKHKEETIETSKREAATKEESTLKSIHPDEEA